MRTAILALASLSCMAVSASAPAFAMEIGRQHDIRDFWLKPQAWSNPRPDSSARSGPPPEFTTTYTAGVARRIGLSGGQMEFFNQPLGGGSSGPAFAGTVDHGAAKLELRWHPGE